MATRIPAENSPKAGAPSETLPARQLSSALPARGGRALPAVVPHSRHSALVGVITIYPFLPDIFR
jgi:hypothetical protein